MNDIVMIFGILILAAVLVPLWVAFRGKKQ